MDADPRADTDTRPHLITIMKKVDSTFEFKLREKLAERESVLILDVWARGERVRGVRKESWRHEAKLRCVREERRC